MLRLSKWQKRVGSVCITYIDVKQINCPVFPLMTIHGLVAGSGGAAPGSITKIPRNDGKRLRVLCLLPCCHCVDLLTGGGCTSTWRNVDTVQSRD